MIVREIRGARAARLGCRKARQGSGGASGEAPYPIGDLGLCALALEDPEAGNFAPIIVNLMSLLRMASTAQRKMYRCDICGSSRTEQTGLNLDQEGPELILLGRLIFRKWISLPHRAECFE